MNELHLREPIYYGDRTTMYCGVAHFRLVDDYGKPKRGNIRIWIDLKVKDKNGIDPDLEVLAYRKPFIIKCEKALTYPTQILTDRNRTMLHIIPISHLTIGKVRRNRTMSQDDFRQITELSRITNENTVE
jgi:hypothetical protein